MQEIIKQKLASIESDNHIRILYSCESGSRGWQFPSPDSDYDVRFIYVQPFDKYLAVTDPADQIGFPINDELDIYGWDIRKVLQLMRKSNTTPFEWLQSPVIYREVSGFRDELWQLCQGYFDQRSNIHHYLGIARGALESMTGNNEIGIKKLFYVLRPLLAAKWCLEKETIAPMSIGPLLTLMPADLQVMVKELIRQKSTASEKFIVSIDQRLKEYIDREYDVCMQSSSNLSRKETETEPLNIFFRKTIKTSNQ